jgi:hypothetical protein
LKTNQSTSFLLIPLSYYLNKIQENNKMANRPTAFKPGQSGNPDGRPKGSKNRTTEELRQHIQTVLDGQYDKLQADLDSMNPFQRVMMSEKLTKYFLPQLSKGEDKVEHSGQVKVIVTYEDTPTGDNSEADSDLLD